MLVPTLHWHSTTVWWVWCHTGWRSERKFFPLDTFSATFEPLGVIWHGHTLLRGL